MSDISESNFNDNSVSPSPYLASNTSSSNLAASGSNTNAANSHVSPSQVADVFAFINYLKQFVPALLDANLASTSDFEKCMNEKMSIETIKKFLGETQVRTLILQKFILKGKFFFYKNIRDYFSS